MREEIDTEMIENLTQKIKNKAHEIGFDVVGITSALPFDETECRLAERVASGLLRDYGFARRPADHFTHPERLLDGAKSIISVALCYKRDDNDVDRHVARFAQGRDYHEVLGTLLKELGDWLVTKVEGANYRAFVDTGSIIDRAVAERAGVGAFGKNALIHTRDYGSWVVLGTLVIDIELLCDEPASNDHCGTCTLCIDACPSGAIVAPYTIDQTKCVSHLTQMKGSIPREMRHLIGTRLYGCDVCQEVCPRNKSSRGGNRPNEDFWQGLDLEQIAQMDQLTFDATIAKTAAGWIGLTRLRRNAVVALGNGGKKSSIAVLNEVLRDEEPMIREHAAWSLGQIGGNDATLALEQSLETETDPTVIEEIKLSLSCSQ